MVDRVVVLRADDGLSFIADACAVMADAVNETRLVTAGHADLVEAYAEMVVWAGFFSVMSVMTAVLTLVFDVSPV